MSKAPIKVADHTGVRGDHLVTPDVNIRDYTWGSPSVMYVTLVYYVRYVIFIVQIADTRLCCVLMLYVRNQIYVRNYG